MGRPIDKTFEELQEEEYRKDREQMLGVKQPLNHVEHDCIPFSLRDYKTLQTVDQVDLQRKILEDPLVLIKQREIECRRKILENPVKLKEMQRILQEENLRRKTGNGSIHNLKSRKVQNEKSHVTVALNVPELDSMLIKNIIWNIADGRITKKVFNYRSNHLLMKKLTKQIDNAIREYRKLLQKSNKKMKYKNSRSSISSRSSETMSKQIHCHHSNQIPLNSKSDVECNKQIKRHYVILEHRQRTTSQSSLSTNHNQNCDVMMKSREYNTNNGKKGTPKQYINSECDSEYDTSKNYNRGKKKECPDKESKGRIVRPASQSSSEGNRDIKYKLNSDKTKLSRSYKDITNSVEADRGVKLAEMLKNAQWRENDRSLKVKQQREKFAMEFEHQNNDRNCDTYFFKEISKAINNYESIGSRLEANINNIQRNDKAMHINFARK